MFTVDYVVVPVDLSANSRGAYALARSIGDTAPQTHVVHAWGGWPPYFENVLFPYAPLGEDAVEFEHEIALEAEAAIFELLDLPEDLPNDIDDPVVLRGEPREVLPEHIQGIAADLIVVSAQGASGILPHSIGSVTERIIRTSRRPVLVARTTESKPNIKTVTVALDLSRGCRKVLEVAMGFAAQLGAELETVYVLPDPVSNDTTQILASILDFHPDKSKKAARGRIDALFENVVKGIDVAYGEKNDAARLLKDRKLLVGDPGPELVKHCAENDRDLLVIGTQDATRKQSQRIGDVASVVLRESTAHTLVVPL